MWRYLLFFALLYFIQGSALAYVINFQKPFLASHGISKETLGLFTSLLILPFIFKVLIGMLSDRLPWGNWGPRKPYMAIGLGLFAASYFTLSHVNPGENFLMFATLTWMASFGLAIFDTCADGWAVDVAEEKDQSSIQAAMIAGKSLGLILMSYFFGLLAERNGFGAVFQILAALSGLVLFIVFWIPYQRRAPAHIVASQWSSLLQGFYLVFAVFGIVYSIASFGTDGLWTLYLSDALHASSHEIGNFGMARGVGALLGAATFALTTRRLGLIRGQFLAMILLGFGCLLPLASLPWMVSGVLWGFCWGFQETSFVTIAMRFAEGPWAATFFAVSMIFSNVGTSLGEALATPLVPQFGFQGVFVGLAVVAWASLIFVWPMLKPLRGSDYISAASER